MVGPYKGLSESEPVKLRQSFSVVSGLAQTLQLPIGTGVCGNRGVLLSANLVVVIWAQVDVGFGLVIGYPHRSVIASRVLTLVIRIVAADTPDAHVGLPAVVFIIAEGQLTFIITFAAGVGGVTAGTDKSEHVADIGVDEGQVIVIGAASNDE